jgi:hypothetical protein
MYVLVTSEQEIGTEFFDIANIDIYMKANIFGEIFHFYHLFILLTVTV